MTAMNNKEFMNAEQERVFATFNTRLADLLQRDPGTKNDAGKPRLGMVLGGFSLALQDVGKAGTQGAEKYTDDG